MTGDVERFPKPDVPWLRCKWETISLDTQQRVARSIDGVWEATVTWANDRTVCRQPHPSEPDAAWCGLPPGHEAPHLGVCSLGRAEVLSLGRVAHPASVSSSASNGSVTRTPPQGSPAGPFEGAVGPAWPHGRGPTPHQSQQRRGLTAAQEDHNQ